MYVYILECADGSYYTGVTNNAEQRLAQHTEGIIPGYYTFSRRPVKMVFCQLFNNPMEAIRFEKRIKMVEEKEKSNY